MGSGEPTEWENKMNQVTRLLPNASRQNDTIELNQREMDLETARFDRDAKMLLIIEEKNEK
jgi:hypothetical protein